MPLHPDMREKFSPEDYLFLKGRGVMDYFAPRDIEDWLHNQGGIIGQEEACKTAAILIHRHYEQNCPSVTLFCGHTGCEKTAMWRSLQKEYSAKNIVIVDASSLTAEGWKQDIHHLSEPRQRHKKALHSRLRRIRQMHRASIRCQRHKLL